MNQFSPSIFDQGVPAERIGGVLIGDSLSPAERHIVMERSSRVVMSAAAAEAEWRKSHSGAYRSGGVATNLNEMVSTGVLVLSPRHREIMEEAYGAEDAGDRCYEQSALSYLILTRSLFYRISARFNWFLWERIWICRKENIGTTSKESLEFLQAEESNAYFLHFAMAQHIMAKIVSTETLDDSRQPRAVS